MTNEVASSEGVPTSFSMAEILYAISRKQFVLGFESFFQQAGVQSVDRQDRYGVVQGHLMVGIIIQGAGFRLTLKALPDLQPLKQVCARVCGLELAQIDELRVRDCVREYLNIVAGGIQSELSKVDLESRLSIPISTRGFDELFFGKPATPIQYQEASELIWEGGRMPLNAFIEFIDLAEVVALNRYDPDAPEQDLFELLVKQEG